jgi:ribose 1,5-bisphosphokinase PhnN
MKEYRFITADQNYIDMRVNALVEKGYIVESTSTAPQTANEFNNVKIMITATLSREVTPEMLAERLANEQRENRQLRNLLEKTLNYLPDKPTGSTSDPSAHELYDEIAELFR